MGAPGPFMERLMLFLGYHAVGLFLRLFCRLRLEGIENIPPGEGVLIVANHISALDVLVLPWCFYSRYPKGLLRQASKEELFRIPVVGWIITKWRAFPIRRGGGDWASIRATERYIREGTVILYPEGTRSRDGKLGPGNRMVGRIIHASEPKVVPVAIRGTDRVVPVGKMLPRPGAVIEVRFGEPIDLSEEYAVENTKEASVRIIDRVMGAIGRLLDGMPGPGVLPSAQEAER